LVTVFKGEQRRAEKEEERGEDFNTENTENTEQTRERRFVGLQENDQREKWIGS